MSPATLRDGAALLDEFARATYPTDVFLPPSGEDLAAVNALLKRERGHQLDGIAAECYRRAIALCAKRLRDEADEIEDATA